jgi:putative transcriptional regulator
MKNVHSKLRLLIAAKEMKERRRLSLRTIEQESGTNLTTVQRLMNDTIKRISLDELSALCRYLECDVGDILSMQEDAA